jgi:hypothetical protein
MTAKRQRGYSGKCPEIPTVNEKMQRKFCGICAIFSAKNKFIRIISAST